MKRCASLFALAFAAFASVASAEEPPPLAGVGLIYRELPIGCTATLVAPDEVLTAAHCVPERTSAGRYAFRTGAYPGYPSRDARAYDVTVHPLYDSETRDIPRRITADIALVRLAEPLPGTVAQPLLPGAPARAGERLLIASWRGEKSLRARERLCPVVEARDDILTLGCEANGGESGAPVLRLGADGPELVAVISSRAEIGPRKYALAAPIGRRLGQLRALMLPRTDGPDGG